jgi:hypothetical protein
MDTIGASPTGTDSAGYYSIDPGFAIGSVVEMRARIERQEGITPWNVSGFDLNLADGARALNFRLYTDRICDPVDLMACSPTFDATTFHNYRVGFSGDDYRLYVDNVLALDGTGRSTYPGSVSYIRMGDQTAGADSVSEVDYAYAYNLGDRLPFVSPGNYVSAPIDTGADDTPHAGTTVTWMPDPPMAGTISFSARSANTLVDLATAPWTAETIDNPAVLPAITGRYLQWRITLTAIPPTETPVVDQVVVDHSCL